MTERKYLLETDLDGSAVVERIGFDNEPFIILNRTWFHVQGGGQPGDRGVIEGMPVTRVVDVGEEIRHYVETDTIDPDLLGQEVKMKVDRTIRTLNSRYHTAGHLIGAIVENLDPSLRAVGGHHWPGEARVEFCGTPISNVDEMSVEVTRRIQQDVQDALLVMIRVEPQSARTVQIGDYPPMGCGGTHIKSTSDLESLRTTRLRIKSGKLRISYQI